MPSTIRYGLRFPDGTESWDKFLDVKLDTAENRAKVAAALAASVANMRLPIEETVDRYKWLTQNVEPAKVHDLTSPLIIENPPEVIQEVPHRSRFDNLEAEARWLRGDGSIATDVDFIVDHDDPPSNVGTQDPEEV